VYPWLARFSPDGTLLFVWYASDPTSTPPPWFTRLRVWGTETGKRVGEFRDGPEEPFHFLPGGKTAVVDDRRRPLEVREAATQKVLRSLPEATRGLICIAVSADGKLLVCQKAHGEELQLWDLVAGKFVRGFGKAPITEGTFSPDGRWFFGHLQLNEEHVGGV